MHNGNMLATPSGKLAYIDFGICSEIPPRVRQSMVVALFYLIHGEYEALADAFVGLALMRPDDMDIELDRFAAALQEAFEYTGEGDPNNGAVCDPHSPVQCQFSLVGVAENLVALSGKFPLVLSPYFIDNLRCLGMLEGLALNADPNFSVLNVLYPFIMRKILAGGPDSMYREALQRVLVNGDGVLDWTKLDAMLNEVQRSERAGVLTAPYATKKKARNVHEPLDDLLLSSKGSFLRSQIMKEWGLPAEKTRYSRTPKAGEVFMGASIGGKLRAVLLFLPVLIMRSVLRAFLGVFAFFFGRRRRKNMVSSDNSKAAGGDSSGEAGLE